MISDNDEYSHGYLEWYTELLILTVSLTTVGHGLACLNTGTHGLLGLKPPLLIVRYFSLPRYKRRRARIRVKEGAREVSGLGGCLRHGHIGPTKAI